MPLAPLLEGLTVAAGRLSGVGSDPRTSRRRESDALNTRPTVQKDNIIRGLAVQSLRNVFNLVPGR